MDVVERPAATVRIPASCSGVGAPRPKSPQHFNRGDFLSMLTRKQYFIREHAGLLKLSDVYDILDPESKVKIGEAREEISALVKILRLLINKSLMPTRIGVYQGADENSRKLVFSIRRGVALLRPKVDVIDASGTSVGYLQSKA